KTQTALELKQAADVILSTHQTIDGLRDELEQRKIITDATIQGGEAYRDAQLQARLFKLNEDILAETNGKVRDSLELLRAQIIANDKAERDEADAQAARAMRSPIEVYQEEYVQLQRAVEALKRAEGGTLSFGQQVMVASREMELFNRAIDDTVKQLLMSDKLRDGMNAFFLDMQKKSQQTASIIYDAFHSAFEKISDNLSSLMIGGKSNFAQMFKDIGKQMAQSAIKQQMQKGLGALGQKMGISLGGAMANPTGKKDDPFYVAIVAGAGVGVGKTGINGIGDVLGKIKNTKGMGTGVKGPLDDILGKVFGGIQNPADSAGGGGGIFASLAGLFKKGGLLSSLFGGGAGGGSGILASLFGGFRAEGGSVSPDKAYLVGESGPEILHGMSGNIANSADSRRVMGGVIH
ncbi:MAG TPA: hypothetical protein DEQ47_15640, partial [Solibacterales bacterium]|nr:hypothetical protein [Bryobacterales bacterium]